MIQLVTLIWGSSQINVVSRYESKICLLFMFVVYGFCVKINVQLLIHLSDLR